MKYILISISLILLGSLISCSDEESLKVRQEDDPVFQLISSFKANLKPGSRATEPFKIKKVETRYYRIENDTVVETLPTRNDDNVFDVETVSLDFGETEGYALISTDQRINQVFFYTEKGELSDTSLISPLKTIIEETPRCAAFIMTDTIYDTRVTNEIIIVEPLVRFEWGQGAPYNNDGLPCTCKDCMDIGGHRPIGCVTTAMAQTIATIGKFKGTYYGTNHIEFDKLPIISGFMDETTQKNIAHFFHEIAVCCQVRFQCDGSGASLKAAHHYLTDMGFTCSYDEHPVIAANLINELKHGYPHIISGFPRSGKGHAWIIDGIKKSYDDNYYTYHCNWGWNGKSNGWISAPYFIDPKDKNINYTKDFKQIYIEDIPHE